MGRSLLIENGWGEGVEGGVNTNKYKTKTRGIILYFEYITKIYLYYTLTELESESVFRDMTDNFWLHFAITTIPCVAWRLCDVDNILPDLLLQTAPVPARLKARSAVAAVLLWKPSKSKRRNKRIRSRSTSSQSTYLIPNSQSGWWIARSSPLIGGSASFLSERPSRKPFRTCLGTWTPGSYPLRRKVSPVPHVCVCLSQQSAPIESIIFFSYLYKKKQTDESSGWRVNQTSHLFTFSYIYIFIYFAGGKIRDCLNTSIY